MAKFNVIIARTSTMIYEYEIEAGSSGEAEQLAKDDHFDCDLSEGREVWAEEVTHQIDCLDSDFEEDGEFIQVLKKLDDEKRA